MSADPQLAAWRLARAGHWARFERVLRSSPEARRFIRMLPYQMYFEGYERAEAIARVLDAQQDAVQGTRTEDGQSRVAGGLAREG